MVGELLALVFGTRKRAETEIIELKIKKFPLYIRWFFFFTLKYGNIDIEYKKQ